MEMKMADISGIRHQYLDIAYDVLSDAQRLDLYLPEEGEGPFAVLIYIHGGGFMMGDKRDDHLDGYLKALQHGMAVASIEYRLSREAKFPAAVLDVRQAVRFLREHAHTYRIDPERMIAIGGSAGGNLAAMLGMNIKNGKFIGEEGKAFSRTPFVSLAIDQFGPMNFLSMDAQARANGISLADHDEENSPESRYLGGAVQEHLELAKCSNPASYIGPEMTKFLVQHGTGDVLVPFEQSVEFVEAIRAKMPVGQVEFVALEGAGHDDLRFSADDNMNLIFEFIKKNLL